MTLTGLLARLRTRTPDVRPSPLILMYHRVADVRIDPWELAVTPSHFAAQMDVLAATRTLLPMSAFASVALSGTLPPDAVAVTFDDGYADTFVEARPRLQAAGVPATLFLATSFVGQRVEYWWDELARLVLERDAAIQGEIVVGGERHRLELATVPDAGHESSGWRGLDTPRTRRQVLFRCLWERVRVLPAEECTAAMDAIRAALATDAPSPKDLPMNAQEVAALAAEPLFEIGGHTATHPVLPSLPPDARRRDIRHGKHACEALTGRAAIGFAYPHGAHDADSRAAVAECGFRWACTTQWRPLGLDLDAYALPRLQVGDWDADTFERTLRGTWV